MAFVRCFSTLGCPDETLEGAAALARRHGLGGIEIRALHGTLELARLWKEQFGEPRRLADFVRAHGTPVVAIDASLRLAGGTAAEREELLELAPWAAALRVPRIRVFDGGKDVDTYPAGEAGETLRWWADECAKRDWSVDLMVETHDSLLTGAAMTRFLADAPKVRFLWDAHHTWRKAGEDPIITWRAVRRHVAHVHVKDSIPVPSARHPFTYVLPGDGGFPIAALLAELRRDAFAGPVSLEWEKQWHPYLPPLETALKTAAERQWW